MKKLVVLLAVLALASAAFAQRASQDTKLGKHDVFLTSALDDRAGCQSCHVPHTAIVQEYIWKYTLPSNIQGWETGSIPTGDNNAFHTVACMSCHDGSTAGAVVTNQMGSGVKFGNDISKHHPTHMTYVNHSDRAILKKFVRFYSDGVDNGVLTSSQTGYNNGYAECGSCHDPHKGDPSKNFKFLRGPSSTTPALAADYGFGWTVADATWGRLGLCRDCHSK